MSKERLSYHTVAVENLEQLRKDMMHHMRRHNYPTQEAFSRAMGRDGSWASGILRGHTKPPPFLLDLLGYERVLVYRKKETADEPQ
jgi:hypothetical protein